MFIKTSIASGVIGISKLPCLAKSLHVIMVQFTDICNQCVISLVSGKKTVCNFVTGVVYKVSVN